MAVLTPVLGRPGRAQPLVDSLTASVTGPTLSAQPWFLVSQGDLEQEQACQATNARVSVMAWQAGPADYALKINTGFKQAVSEDFDFCLLGADDLVFHPGWLEAALIEYLETGACVVGTNDLANNAVKAGTHATHSLVHRDYYGYGTVDGTGPILCELYDHQFVDTELVGYARASGNFAFAARSHVEHRHPFWGTAEMDSTYRKALAHADADRRLFMARRRLWAAL